MKSNSMGASLREAKAMLTQARYLSKDLGVVHEPGSGPNIILLHGLYASAGVWRPLKKLLKTRFDAAIHSFSYLPGVGIAQLSTQLTRLVAEIESPHDIHMIGHSLGGLVQRYYVVQAGRDPRIQQTTSLASPFKGSNKNHLVPGQAGRDIAPGSSLLAELRHDSEAQRVVPHLALLADEDQAILPGAYPAYGQHALMKRVGHNGILFHEPTMTRIVNRITEYL